MDESEKVTVYSYIKVWKGEKKIYAITNWILPAPINPYQFFCFIGCFLFFMYLSKIVPFFSSVPSVIRYIVLPYGITRYLLKKKLDGKNPVFYLFGLLIYFFTIKGTYIEKFRVYAEKERAIKCRWFCSSGCGRRKASESMSNYLL